MIAAGFRLTIGADWTTKGGVIISNGTSYATNAEIIASGLPVTIGPVI
jgi:hypothetical protein